LHLVATSHQACHQHGRLRALWHLTQLRLGTRRLHRSALDLRINLQQALRHHHGPRIDGAENLGRHLQPLPWQPEKSWHHSRRQVPQHTTRVHEHSWLLCQAQISHKRPQRRWRENLWRNAHPPGATRPQWPILSFLIVSPISGCGPDLPADALRSSSRGGVEEDLCRQRCSHRPLG
jgi:hypothetical protein